MRIDCQNLVSKAGESKTRVHRFSMGEGDLKDVFTLRVVANWNELLEEFVEADAVTMSKAIGMYLGRNLQGLRSNAWNQD